MEEKELYDSWWQRYFFHTANLNTYMHMSGQVNRLTAVL